MFTGLIEEIGVVSSVIPVGRGRRISVKASKILEDLKVDDSVSINGACQTVVSRDPSIFIVEAIEETIRKTTLGKLISGDKVNLERALKVSDRLGGHLVQGHIDCTGNILSIEKLTTSNNVWIKFPRNFSKYIVSAGSICVNGVSLTVAECTYDRFKISVIPHTWKVTILNNLRPGSEVNLEFDILGKYIEKMFPGNIAGEGSNSLDKYIDQPDF